MVIVPLNSINFLFMIIFLFVYINNTFNKSKYSYIIFTIEYVCSIYICIQFYYTYIFLSIYNKKTLENMNIQKKIIKK